MPREISSGLAGELHAAAVGSFEKWARTNTQSSDPDTKIRAWLALDLMQRVKDLEAFEKEVQSLMFPVMYAFESALTPDTDDEDVDEAEYVVEQVKRAVTSIVHSQNALASKDAPLLTAWTTVEARKVADAAGVNARGGGFSEETLERMGA